MRRSSDSSRAAFTIVPRGSTMADDPYDSSASVFPAKSARMIHVLFSTARATSEVLASVTSAADDLDRGRPLFVGMNRAAAPRDVMCPFKLGEIRVVADEDSERQPADLKDRCCASGLVHGAIDGRVYLAIQPGNGASFENRRSVINAVSVGELREADDRRDRVAWQEVAAPLRVAHSEFRSRTGADRRCNPQGRQEQPRGSTEWTHPSTRTAALGSGCGRSRAIEPMGRRGA